MSAPRLILYSRAGCHLCDEGRSVVERVLAAGPAFELQVVDVDQEPELAARYGNEVPVLVLDGRKIAKVRFDEGRLRRSLRHGP
jgi:glutaredoxin